MTTSAAAAPRRRNRSALAITAGIVAGLLIAFFIFAGIYADILWYDQLGFVQVLYTQWGTGAVLFLVGFLSMALAVFVSIVLAYRFRPIYAQPAAQLDRYQQVIEPLRRLATFGIPAVLGLFAGVSAASRWQTALLYFNRTPTGQTDPQFNLDISFYLFELPFVHGIVGFASAVVLVAGLIGLATNYLYGAIRSVGREVRVSRGARIQLAITAGLYIALQAISVWLDQYETLSSVSTGALITGASYTDVNAVIPGRQILAVITALIAIVFFITAIIGRWRFPVIGTALLVVASLVVGSLYPWIMQRFQVDPNELTVERAYIERNIDMTREAYGVADIEEIPYDATTEATQGALRADAETTANIRILDPAIVSPSFAQLQRFRQYYEFGTDLDVDRYEVDGQTTDAVVAVRELNQSGLGDSQTWFNRTVVYTHGYGLVAAYGNQRSADGQPVFLESDIPTTGELGEYEPRVYFGEDSPEYSIVGAPEGSDPVELDYPSGGGEDSESQVYTTFDGDGGPSVGNWFTKLIYALKFQSEEIFLSDAVNSESQILYDRDPRERVQKVAPYLTIDSDAYPTVVDGRLKWVVDAYTTSSSYPYSKVQSLSDAIADSFTPAPSFAVDDVNYIRNSVKATVDAYDGSVDLYVWDEEDPVITSWQKVFPTNILPLSEMSGDLMSHVRYPQDLFKVQRAILGTYHVTEPDSWYQADDAWRTPPDPTAAEGTDVLQPPYYLTLEVPGSDAPSYSLYSTFIPLQGAGGQSILTGYLAVDADAGSTAGEKAESYGTLRLLELPKDETVPGPGQVQNTFNSDNTVATELNLLRQGGSNVDQGNLLTLPVGGGLLYVQPVYVSSSGETSLPLLRRVLVSFGDRVAFEDTLDAALDELFGGDSGADAGDTDVPDVDTDPADPTAPVDPVPDTGGGAVTDDLADALADASTALLDREAAYRANDLVAAAEADARLQEAIDRALAAQG